MSTYVCGFMKLSDKEISVQRLRDFSFELQRVANTCTVGINIGINATSACRYIKSSSERILFELTDSPFEQTAEILFAPESGLDFYEDGFLSSRRSLIERIKDIKRILFTVFEFDFVEEVSLIINYIFDDIDCTRRILLDEFEDCLLRDYRETKNLIPAVEYIIRNDN